MLHSKYLTQEGIEIILKTLYKSGWRYINKMGQSDAFYTSIEKPLYCEEASCFTCSGPKYFLEDSLNMLIADALNGRDYVTITDHIDIIDWSTVKVDTPVLVSAVEDGQWTKRYFAAYKGGKVYAWIGGATSWSTDSNKNVSSWDYAKLSED